MCSFYGARGYGNKPGDPTGGEEKKGMARVLLKFLNKKCTPRWEFIESRARKTLWRGNR